MKNEITFISSQIINFNIYFLYFFNNGNNKIINRIQWNIVTHVKANFDVLCISLMTIPSEGDSSLSTQNFIPGISCVVVPGERHRHRRNASFELLKKCIPAGKYSRWHGVIRSSGNIRQSGDCAASTTPPLVCASLSTPPPSLRQPLLSMQPDVYGHPLAYPVPILTYPIASPVIRFDIDLLERRAGPWERLLLVQFRRPSSSPFIITSGLSSRLAENFYPTSRIQE